MFGFEEPVLKLEEQLFAARPEEVEIRADSGEVEFAPGVFRRLPAVHHLDSGNIRPFDQGRVKVGFIFTDEREILRCGGGELLRRCRPCSQRRNPQQDEQA